MEHSLNGEIGVVQTPESSTARCDIAHSEARRLIALEALQIFETLPEDAYDRIVRRVSQFLHVPICLISFIGKDDLWFKAKVGVDISSTPRDRSFCQAALEHDGVFVVPDAANSDFATHSFVTEPPHLRFYAGVALVVDGTERVGTLCILDTVPRELAKADIDALEDFAALVVDELHLRMHTKRLEAELTRRRLEEEAKLASQKARADFLAMVTHEVRAPLNAIAGMVELMCNPTQDVPNEITVEMLRHSTEHLVRMINEVLDLAKLEASGFTFNREPFDLRRELLRTLAIVRPESVAKGIRLSVNFATDLAQVVEGDRTRVSQILLNLLTNAIKFTDRGSVTVGVTSRVASEKRVEVTFHVEDTGIGMSSSSVDQMFSHFGQASQQTRARYGGTGLGLAICQKLVEAMDGVIDVSSELGRGTTFRCTIPFTLAGRSAIDLLTDRDHNNDQPVVQSIRREDELVLIVDDDPICLKVGKAIISRLGYQVEAFGNGRDALEALRTRPFDLAVIDLNMPDLDGLSLARQLHRQPEFGLPVPLIALTGNEPPYGESRLALFADHLVKPVNAVTLDCAFMKILSRRESVVTTDENGGEI